MATRQIKEFDPSFMMAGWQPASEMYVDFESKTNDRLRQKECGFVAIDEQEKGYGVVIIKGRGIPKKNVKAFAECLIDENQNKIIAVTNHLYQLLDVSPFPEIWIKDDIERPTRECRSKAISMASDIFGKYELLPIRIAPSIEEGVLVAYFDKNNNKSLKIEVYNTLEAAGIISQDKQIVLSLDIENQKDLGVLLNKYKEL